MQINPHHPMLLFLHHFSEFLNRAKIIFRKENLLLANALFCFCYASCYIFLISMGFSEEAMKGLFFTCSVTILNIIFLVVMILNLNTISTVYRLINKDCRHYIKFVYYITLTCWLFYVLAACYLTFFVPGFITHFHHYIRNNFQTSNWKMISIAFIFGTGLSLLFIEYYRQIKMSYLLFFIVPAILHFAFKSMFPFLFFVTGWLVYCGCQLMLYFSILDLQTYKIAARGPAKKREGYYISS